MALLADEVWVSLPRHYEFPAASNACVVDDVAKAVERHHERRLVHVERVGDRGLGLIVRLWVDVRDNDVRLVVQHSGNAGRELVQRGLALLQENGLLRDVDEGGAGFGVARVPRSVTLV